MKKWGWLFIPVFMLWMVIFMLLICSAEENLFEKGRKGDISFLSGGVGKQEREIIKEIGKAYPLKLIFSNKKGEYLSDVSLKVFDQKGKTILTTVSNGPWLFIDLPSGIYNLEASFKEERKKVSEVNIEKGTQKVVSI